MDPPTVADAVVLKSQLGRTPRGLLGIARRCPYGFPQVIAVYPIVDDKPFPTTYWLTCPHLSRHIGRIEAAGMIGLLEKRVREQPGLRDALDQSHRAAIAVRRQLLSGEDQTRLEQELRLGAVLSRGIGGIADWSRLKCLHLHVAYALAQSNPIGDLVLAELGPTGTVCPEERKICSAR
ncbi:DUF501 domain-containing protein [Candidatus Bipolaricaulota bacterium]|nr:DUF501 domain-containing protein [Candidatus Bipolaricaulota bacterium]